MGTASRVLGTLVCALGLCGGAAANAAPILSLTPSETTVRAGDGVVVDVIVDGLDGSQVGAFDITIGWSGSALAFESAQFDSFLDGPELSLRDVLLGPNSVNAFEVSLSDLALQSGRSSFRLFSLLFTGIADGSSDLSVDSLTLSDALGGPLSATAFGTRITVQPASVSVPEPDSLVLLLVGFIGAIAIRRRFRVR